MKCTRCAHDNPAGNRFCGGCGAALEASCATCGHANPPDHRFCGGCGASLVGAASATQKRDREPRAYTPKHLADKILASKSALEGERKQVTVLFADVKGSMELADSVDPEEWHRILDEFFAILADGVHRFEGTVNQYTGDGIMALFGAPIAHEDHAQRACYAALSLRDRLREYGREVKRRTGLTLSTRFGINSGDVIVGRIGDDLRMDYTAQGLTVGLAQRMEALASPDTIYLAPGSAVLVSGYFALDDLGEFTLKSVSEPVHAFELKGLGPAHTRFDLSRTRGLSKFVGRDKEMALLEGALARAIEGHGQVVGVVAEAGTGKSRLAFEFAERCRARGIAVRTTSGVAHGKSVPLLPVREYYRQSFGIEPHDSDAEVRRKIAGSVVALDESLVSSLPLLYDFLAVPDPEKPLKMAPGPERQRALLALLKRLMLERSRRAPWVILFEDLHWIDSATAAFLENLVDGAGSSRTLLVVNFRPEFRADWMGRSFYQQITLAPLDATAFAEMLSETLGSDASLAGLADRIRSRSAGNPFFAEEIVQSLVEAGALEGVRGRYRLVKSLDTLAVPPTVQAVLAARIDRLPEREKHALQTAAVIGREFPLALLQRVAELDDDSLDAALRALVQAEFLLETALYPDAAYAFKHPLTQDVALGSQLRERRARVHAAVARALSDIHAGKLDEHAALLALHWEAAGNAPEAARWHARVAERAGGVDAAEALERWRRVEALLSPLAEDHEVLWLRASAIDGIVRGNARSYAPLDEVDRLYATGLDVARRAGHRRAEAMLHYGRGLAHFLQGGVTQWPLALREAAAIAEADGDTPLQLAISGFGVAEGGGALGDIDRVIELTGGNPAAGIELLEFSPLLTLLVSKSIWLAIRGRLREAAQPLSVALALLDDFDDPLAEIRVRGELTSLAIDRGDPAAALQEAFRCVQVSQRTSHRNFKLQALSSLAAAYAAAEDWSAVTRTLDEIRAFGILARLLTELFVEATLRIAEGRFADALSIAERITTHEQPFQRARAYLLRARSRIRSEGAGAHAAVAADHAQVEALIDATGLEFWRPPLHESRAELARVLGDGVAAEHELREAQRLYAAMGADGHAERLARALRP